MKIMEYSVVGGGGGWLHTLIIIEPVHEISNNVTF